MTRSLGGTVVSLPDRERVRHRERVTGPGTARSRRASIGAVHGPAGGAAAGRAGIAAAGPADLVLPTGLRIALDRRARLVDGGGVLIGGAPPRLMRLNPAARALLGGADSADRPAAAAGAGATRRPGGTSGAGAPRRPGGICGAGAPGRAVGFGFTVAGPTSAALARRLLDAGIAHPVSCPQRAVPPPADVTVVVPVRDRTAGLARLIGALPDGLGGLVVVDDGSRDPGAVSAVAGRAGARLLRHDRPRGPAAARNAGLAVATTPLVAFLDSDVVPEPGWLAPLLAGFADPAVGLVAPRIVAMAPIRGWLARYEAVHSSLDLGQDPALIVPRSRVAYVPSAALLVRREAVGTGFDERMHVGEDVDLVLRLHAAGWRLRYQPAARVAHAHRTAPREWLARKAFYGTSAAPLALRHPGGVPPLVLSPWSAAVGVAALSWRPRTALAAVAVGTVSAYRLAGRLGPVRRPLATAAALVAAGGVGALWQTAAAVTRHHWPLAAAACLVSSRARRTVAGVALAEGLADWWRHRGRDPRVRPDPLCHLLAHRLDDLAYGAGLWWGALSHRTLEPLRPVGAGTARAGRRTAGPGQVRVSGWGPSVRVSPND